MILFCCASELGPPEDVSAIEVILYYYYYARVKITFPEQWRRVTDKVITSYPTCLCCNDYPSVNTRVELTSSLRKSKRE